MATFVDFNEFSKMVNPKLEVMEQEIFQEVGLQPMDIYDFDVTFEVVSYPQMDIATITDQGIDEVVAQAKQSLVDVIKQHNVQNISNLIVIRADKPEEKKVGFVLFFYCNSAETLEKASQEENEQENENEQNS